MKTPLQGLKILDFTGLLPGPFATMILADLGADVIRLEAFDRPDLLRQLEPKVGGVSVAHAHLNRGKRSLGINLKDSKGQKVVRDLLESAGFDIILEGFRPGVMAKFGLSYADLRERLPRLIYCSLTGYGQTGPKAQKAGHDINYLAESGIASYSGRASTGPSPQGIQIADTAGGSVHAVIAILAAVVHRQNTGEGQYCDVSITDASLSLNALFGAAALQSEKDPGLESNELNGAGLYDYYRCLDGRYLAFGGIEPKFIQNFLETLGLAAELPALVKNAPSAAAMASLKSKVQGAIAAQDRDTWIELFSGVDACVSPVQRFSEIGADPHFKQRGMIRCIEASDGTVFRQVNSPFRFSTLAPRDGWPGGSLGADNHSILQSLLAYDQRQIDELTTAGAIGAAGKR